MSACSIFDEDEVCIPISSGGYKYGLVVESSEYVSSDDEDEEDENRVKKGQLKVAWHPSGEETVVSEDTVILTDRSLMPGDVIRRLISGEDSQRGFVQSSNIKCHLKILGTEQYIYNVDAKDISPIQEFDPEPEVTLDSWVGHVMEVSEEITVRFPCGARCSLSNAGMLNLEDVQDKRKQHTEFAMRNFYPGQELKGSYDDYDDAKWINTSNVRGPKCKVRSLFNATVIVEEVRTESVEVNWVCKGFTHTGAGTDKLKHPPAVVEGDNLKRLRRLDCFEHCHMQIGDKGYYVVKDTDTLLYKLSPRKQVVPDIVQIKEKKSQDAIDSKDQDVESISKKRNSLDQNENNEKCNGLADDNKENIKIKDKAVVKDDDFEDIEDDASDTGSESGSNHSGSGSPATKRKNRKRPCMSAHGLKRLRGKKAKKKGHHLEREVKPGDRVAVEIWYTFSTCNVMWQDGSVEDNVPSPELYPIHHLDELEFFPGDFVLDNKGMTGTDYGVVVSSDHKERTVMVKWVKPYTPGKSNKPEEQEPVELSVFDLKDHPDYKFRCGHTVIRVGGYEEEKELEAVGQVFKLNPDGTIEVWWPDNTLTTCYPQELYIIGDEFQSESGSESEEWSEEEEEDGSDVSWETENEEEGSDSESDTNAKKKKPKQPWTVNDVKKKELDVLLDRAHGAVDGLLKVFQTAANPYTDKWRQVYKDILAIFKRCKEVEKILQSSFFESEEIGELISTIKDELRKEKTAKFAMHVAQVYKTRTSTDGNQVNDSDQGDNQTPVKETSVENGAVGASGETQKESAEVRRIKEVLKTYSANIEDPMLRIIFDTTLQSTIAESAQKNRAKCTKYEEAPVDQGFPVSAKKDDAIIDDKDIETRISRDSVSDFIQTVIGSVCDEKNIEDDFKNVLEVVLQDADLYMKEGSSQTEETQFTDQSSEKLTESHTEKQAGALTKNQLDNKEDKADIDTKIDSETENLTGSETCENQKSSSNSSQAEAVGTVGATETDRCSPNYIMLCTKVCKAMNVGLLLVKQEVNRRWLAYKFGCDENSTDIELFEKMQAKMIESIESGKGPLDLNDMPAVLDEDTTRGTESIKELESLEKKRSSPETELPEQPVDEQLELENDDVDLSVEEKGFEVCSDAPATHRFKYEEEKPLNQKSFMSAVRKEWNLLKTSLPDGIFVKVFEDRMDLMSAMIQGPAHTPYEDGLFLFDIRLPASFPNSPPVFHYHSYCSERLNPNLYEDGKVCVSLLGTWTGKGSELWTSKSSVLQVLVSIQGLILVPEPYFNEAGYEKQRGSQHGQENSRMYNEMAILKLIQSMMKMAITPPGVFVEETRTHLKKHGLRMIQRVEKWVELSKKCRLESSDVAELQCNGDISENAKDEKANETTETISPKGAAATASRELTSTGKPDFPLLPASKGFCISIVRYLEYFREVLREHV